MDYLRDKAREFCFSEDWMGLLEYTSSWIANDDRSHDANYYQAIAFKNLQMPDKAEMLYKDVLGIKPDSLDAWSGLAVLAIEQERYQEGERFLQRALELSPDDLNNNINIARLYGYQKKYSEALIYFRKAQKISPFNAEFFAEFCLTLKKAEEKIDYYEKVQYLKFIDPDKYKKLCDWEDPSKRMLFTVDRVLFKFVHLKCHCRSFFQLKRNYTKHYYRYKGLLIMANSLVKWCNDCKALTSCEDLSNYLNPEMLIEQKIQMEKDIETNKSQLDSRIKQMGFVSRLLTGKGENEPENKEIEKLQNIIKVCEDYLCLIDLRKELASKRKPICFECFNSNIQNVITCSIRTRKMPTNLKCPECSSMLKKINKWDIDEVNPHHSWRERAEVDLQSKDPEKRTAALHILAYPGDRRSTDRYKEISLDGYAAEESEYSYIWPGFKDVKGEELMILSEFRPSFVPSIIESSKIKYEIDNRERLQDQWS